MSRRLILCCLFAAASVSQTGCCGRVRSFFYRLTHCPPGCCYPAYPYADGPLVPTGPVSYGGPVVGDGVPGPVFGAGGPGCASCYSSPVEPAAGIPVVPGPVVGGPVFTGPSVPSAPPAQMPPPGVYSTPQTAEPPGARPMK
jgi:hypothetical protein